jgi:predicted dehydrogenase
MTSRSTLHRRRFLRNTAALAAGTPLFGVPNILSARAKGDKLGIAVIGCGGQGGGNPGLAASERLVALVDVDDKKLGTAVENVKAKVSNPKTYYDYRKMFDECHKEIDAVLIATPDHHHAPAAIRAIQLGKHVFCEKPLTWCLYEARKLTESARKYKVATQMGNQGHSGEGYRRLCEYLWAGAIGNVTETHSIMSRNFGGNGGRPAKKDVPAGLHWDEWLGPASARDFHDGLHPFGWRSWCEFGTSSLGDMGCHVLDGVHWALKLGEAKKFTIECLAQTPGSKEMYARDNHIHWEFPARGDMPAVKVNTYDQKWPDFVKALAEKHGEKFEGGTLYIGDKGTMFTGTYGDNPRIIPKDKHDAFPKPEAKIPREKGGNKGAFLAACKGGPPASSNFDVSGPFTEFILSGVLASKAGVGKKIEWDVEKLLCTNVAEVNQWVKRDYRKGWEV